jgi:hypothetical protein
MFTHFVWDISQASTSGSRAWIATVVKSRCRCESICPLEDSNECASLPILETVRCGINGVVCNLVGVGRELEGRRRRMTLSIRPTRFLNVDDHVSHLVLFLNSFS